MPAGSAFPEPEDCIKLKDRFLSPPKPIDALDDFMSVIEGDETPWSYLSASIFAREAWEFGALWHGCSWSTHEILGQNPWTASKGPKKYIEMDLDSKEWTGEEQRPEVWDTYVEETSDFMEVSFISFTALGLQRLIHHKDRYAKGKYNFDDNSRVLGSGPGGFIF